LGSPHISRVLILRHSHRISSHLFLRYSHPVLRTRRGTDTELLSPLATARNHAEIPRQFCVLFCVSSASLCEAQGCSRRKGVYNPKAFFPHAASLGQGFPHCPIFSAAASRRSGTRVSVSLAAATLSGHLPVIGLVGHYPTNYLIDRGPFPERFPFGFPLPRQYMYWRGLSGISLVSQIVPVSGVGYPRVTAPFATNLALRARRGTDAELLSPLASTRNHAENFRVSSAFCSASVLRPCPKDKVRTTCMPYPRRQRSAWTRIKSSRKN